MPTSETLRYGLPQPPNDIEFRSRALSNVRSMQRFWGWFGSIVISLAVFSETSNPKAAIILGVGGTLTELGVRRGRRNDRVEMSRDEAQLEAFNSITLPIMQNSGL